MVIRTGVSACECAEVVLDVERLDEVHILSCHQLEDICDKASSYVSLRNEHAYVLVEPLRIESGAASGSAERSLVDIVIYVAVDVVLAIIPAIDKRRCSPPESKNVCLSANSSNGRRLVGS